MRYFPGVSSSLWFLFSSSTCPSCHVRSFIFSLFFFTKQPAKQGRVLSPREPPCHHSTLRGNPPIIPFTSSLLNLILGFFFHHLWNRLQHPSLTLLTRGRRAWTKWEGVENTGAAALHPFLPFLPPPLSPLALGQEEQSSEGHSGLLHLL